MAWRGAHPRAEGLRWDRLFDRHDLTQANVVVKWLDSRLRASSRRLRSQSFTYHPLSSIRLAGHCRREKHLRRPHIRRLPQALQHGHHRGAATGEAPAAATVHGDFHLPAALRGAASGPQQFGTRKQVSGLSVLSARGARTKQHNEKQSKLGQGGHG